jgi:hypothetical protein
LVFGVSPPLVLTALFAIALFCMEAFDSAFKQMMARHENAVIAAFPYAGSLFGAIIPSVLVSIAFCKLAKRMCIGSKWMLLSCVLVAALSATPWFLVTKHSDAPGDFSGVVNLCIPQRAVDLPKMILFILHRPQQILQLLCPLAVGFWFLRRNRRGDIPQSVVGAPYRAA